MFRSYLATGLVVLLPSLAGAQAISSETCARLASLRLPNTTITTAELISGGTFVPPGGTGTPNPNLSDLPPFCRVAATLKPVPGSDIKIEVWLPAATCARAAQKLDQYAARKVDHSESGSFYAVPA